MVNNERQALYRFLLRIFIVLGKPFTCTRTPRQQSAVKDTLGATP